jgi:chromatin structure-remodeling complex subunit RSC1/2
VNKDGRPLGHSARFLAGKAEWEAKRAAKRKERDAEAAKREQAAKKARTEADEQLTKDIADLKIRAMTAWEDQLAAATKKEFEALFPAGGKPETMMKWLNNLTGTQKVAMQKNVEWEQRKIKELEGQKIPITGMTVRLEDKF